MLGLYRGGGEYFDLNMAYALQELGCKVSFITGKPLYKCSRMPIRNFDTDYISSPYLRYLMYKTNDSKWPLLHAASSMIGSILDAKFFEKGVLYKLAGQKHYDIIQVCGYPTIGLHVKEKLKIPVVVRFPGPPGIEEIKAAKGCSAIIANGDTADVIKKSFGVNVFTISPGVNIDVFKPVKNNIREKYNIDSSKILLFVGRFVPLKNLEFLIETLKEVFKERKDTVLILVGEGPLENKIKKKVKEYNLMRNVIFTGRIIQEDLPHYYSASHIFLMPSAYENFSNAILEAMACKLPVIATNIGGNSKQIKDGENGFLVSNNNVQQFKEAIIKLLDNEVTARKMGERNREIIKQNYNWQESAGKLKKIYESLLG